MLFKKKNTHEHSWQKYPVLFSLYIAQSIPMSFFSTVVPVIMRQEKYSLESIGMLQLVKLPWIFKFLWAPFIDNKARSRRQLRQWIIVSELVYAAVILIIGVFDLQTDFKLIVFIMVFAFIASATQDIATDIFAIRILKKEERSLGNSMQAGGSFVGSLFGTGVLLIAYYYFGWSVLLFVLATFVLFAVVPLLLYKPTLNDSKKSNERVGLEEIVYFFKEKILRRRIGLLLTFYSGIIGILAMLKPYMVDLGYNAKQIGFMSGIIGTATASLFAIIAGHSIRFIGKQTFLYISASFSLLTATYFWYISQTTPSLAMLYVGICALWAAYGMATVIIYTTSMDVVRKGREGTDFTLQIVITHISGIVVAILSGRIGDALGYTGIFGVEVILCLVAILMVFYVLKGTKDEGKERVNS
jgi:MFS family permease